MFMNWKLHKDKLTSFPIFWTVRIETWLSELSLPLQKLLKLALTCKHLLFQYCQQLLVVVSVSLLPDVLVWLHTCNVLFLDYILKDPGGLTDYIAAEYIPDFLGGPYEVSKAMRYSVKLPWTVTRISKQCLLASTHSEAVSLSFLSQSDYFLFSIVHSIYKALSISS